MTQIESWSPARTDKTNDTKFDSLFTNLAPDVQSYSSQFNKSSSSASEALVANNVLPGLSLDGCNSADSGLGSLSKAQAGSETAGASNPISLDLALLQKDLSALSVDLSDLNQLLTGQQSIPSTGSDGGVAAAIPPSTSGEGTIASAVTTSVTSASGEAAAVTPTTSSGEAAAVAPITSSGEAAAVTPTTSSGEAAAVTPTTSSGEAAAVTPTTSSGEAAAVTPTTSSGEAAAVTPTTSSGEAAAVTPTTSSGEAAAVTPTTSSGESAAITPSTASGAPDAGTTDPTSGAGSDSGAIAANSASSPTSGDAGMIGFFGGDTNAAEADSISSALGKTVVPSAFLDWTQPAAQTTQYETGQYASWVAANPGKGMIVAVPLTYDGQSLASTASGANNSEFTEMAQQLVAAGQGNDTIRLGVEMNGPWATDNNDGNPTDSINAYNNAAQAMKAVPGANFKFDWNPSDGEQNGIPTENYYPGNANVNSIGVDVYDWNESNPNATPAQTWNLLTTEAGGLNELAAFAQQQGKPFAIPEYAVSAPEGQAGNANATSPGMGDDPSFITNIANFLNTQAQAEGVAFQTYFDSPSGGVGTTLETSPNSYNAYINAFGNGGIDGAEV